MALKILDVHHHAVRVAPGDASLEAQRRFYGDLLGLETDRGRPNIPGIPGFWFNVGTSGQIHLIACDGPSPLSKSPEQDPTAPHFALAVESIAEAKRFLDENGVRYWTLSGIAGPEAEQVFLQDPAGNMVELHQYDQCRCRTRE
jgi:catechol 2,3-dioxygenase-like lactoylglutathione lyase family enzyme